MRQDSIQVTVFDRIRSLKLEQSEDPNVTSEAVRISLSTVLPDENSTAELDTIRLNLGDSNVTNEVNFNILTHL